jgi:hypothetical protein
MRGKVSRPGNVEALCRGVAEQSANLPKTLLGGGILGDTTKLNREPESPERCHIVSVPDQGICAMSEEEPHHVDIEPGCSEPQCIHASWRSALMDGLGRTAVKEEPSYLQ